MVSHILIDRLKRCYWSQHLADYYTEHDPLRCEPIEYADDVERVKISDYDERRVRFFVDELHAGRKLDPIQIDSRWHYNRPDPPSVIDGHHRYVAAVIAGEKKIAADCGGVVSMIRWLEGKRKTVPKGFDL